MTQIPVLLQRLSSVVAWRRRRSAWSVLVVVDALTGDCVVQKCAFVDPSCLAAGDAVQPWACVGTRKRVVCDRLCKRDVWVVLLGLRAPWRAMLHPAHVPLGKLLATTRVIAHALFVQRERERERERGGEEGREF